MTPYALLPPIPQPPHDPTSWLLNAHIGWREADNGFKGIEKAPPTLALALAPAPDGGRSLTEVSGSFGGLTVPANMALGPDGSIYLLDAKTLELERFDPCECLFKTVPCFGGEGGGARQLRNPHGIGICAGNLFVCDTGVNGSATHIPCSDREADDRRIRRENHRLSVFSLRGFVLRAHWTPPASAYQGPEPTLTTTWEPYDIAFDARGRVYVTDGANGCIHRFSPSGRWETRLAGLGKVTYLAIDCQDRLYVVTEGKERSVRIVDTDGKDLGTADRPEALIPMFPRPSFVVDAEGHLHLGLLCVAPESKQEKGASKPTRPRPERGVFDLHGDLVPNPKPPAPPGYQTSGTYYSRALDSELYRCQWHRIVLHGKIPSGARVLVSTYTAEAAYTDEQILNLPEEAWETHQTAREMEGGRWILYPNGQYVFVPAEKSPDGTPNDTGQWDCLVRSSGGRYLWLRLAFQGNGKVTPMLESIVIEFPRIGLRRFLPAVFGEEPTSSDFTDRFLSLFDTTLRRVETEIDQEARYFDPLSTPAERDPKTGLDFLSWLASWIGMTLDRHWPEAKRREFLKRAGKLYDLRGTREGLWRQLLLLLGMEVERCCCPDDQPKIRCRPNPPNCAPVVRRPCAWEPPPLILEHFQLRRWLFVGAGRLGDEAVLWGKKIVNRSQLDGGAQVGHSQLITTQDPYRDPFHVYAHKFTVFVPACFGRPEAQRKALDNLLKAESPGHTLYQVQYVEPRFRIGVQSTIGLDSVIARLPQDGTTLGEMQLGPASVLTAPPHEQGGPSFEVGESRIGTTTKLD
jgi:phage tail-like protein